MGSYLYFVSRNSSGNTKLYRTDGVTLIQISDIRPGASDDIDCLIALNSKLYFSASDSSGNSKFFRYDPATSAITQVSDIFSETDDSIAQSLMAFGNSIYFSMENADGENYLYRFDTETNQITQITQFVDGDEGDDPQGMTALGNSLYFTANTALVESNAAQPRIFRYQPDTHALSQITDHDSELIAAADGKLYYKGTVPEGYSNENRYKLYEITIEEL
jgi:Tol biopolymer transport system component